MSPGKYLALTPAVLALALGACGSNKQQTYETDQTDLVVETTGASDVPVDLPTTPMTNGPASTEAPATPK